MAEYLLPKQKVAGSNPVSRSNFQSGSAARYRPLAVYLIAIRRGRISQQRRSIKLFLVASIVL